MIACKIDILVCNHLFCHSLLKYDVALSYYRGIIIIVASRSMEVSVPAKSSAQT